MIRILVVDDVAFIRHQILNLLNATSDCSVIGEAQHGNEAVEMTVALKPDLILMDVEMPVCDGIEATKRIMALQPTPILIFTSSTVLRARNLPFEAIRAGALDLIEKPVLFPPSVDHVRTLLGRIRLLSGLPVIRRFGTTPPLVSRPAPLPLIGIPKLIAMAGSTGAPRAYAEFFGTLPTKLEVPIVLLQHIGAAFMQGFVDWIQGITPMHVTLVQEERILEPGVIHVAPPDFHLVVTEEKTLRLDGRPPVHHCRPSADLLFHSVARNYGATAVGIILSGLGVDGAAGLAAIKNEGGTTMAQDRESAVVFGMPAAAIALRGVHIIGTPELLASSVAAACGGT